jgi:hypothetical protein
VIQKPKADFTTNLFSQETAAKAAIFRYTIEVKKLKDSYKLLEDEQNSCEAGDKSIASVHSSPAFFLVEQPKLLAERRAADFVSGAQLFHSVHAIGYSPEDRIIHIQEGRRPQGYIKLAGSAVGIG